MSDKNKLMKDQNSESSERFEDGRQEKEKSSDSKKMSDKDKLVEDQKSESSEQSEDDRKEKEKSSDSKNKEEPGEDRNKSSSKETPKNSESNKDNAEETNEQKNFLEKQEKLLENVFNIEKEQSVQSNIRPCKSCELLKPIPRQRNCCARLCPIRKQRVPKVFWIVSVPGDPTPQEAFNKLKDKTEAKKLTLIYKFHIPKLKIGTLDELMYLTDELKKLDKNIEGIVHKFIEFVHEVLEGVGNIRQFFEVNDMDVVTYISRFTWNQAKYDEKKPLSVLHDLTRAEMRRLGEMLKLRMDDFRQLDRSLEKIERQQTGNLLTRSLSGIVKKEHFVLDSGYLTTLLVVVPINDQKKWLKSYHKFADMVVPNSTMKIFEDKTHILYTVVLCKKNMEEFKMKAREQKFIVRDFEYCEEELAEEKDIRKKLRKMKKVQIAILSRWIRANFNEGFAAWMHVKAMQILVESVLRFGLSSNFQAMILIPLKNKDQLKAILDEMYTNVDNELAAGVAKDVPGSLAPYEVAEYNPYVFSKFKFDAKLSKKETES